MVTVFIDDDAGYVRWVGEHSEGFVLNSSIHAPSSSSHVLHRATCWTVTGTPARGSHWTNDYLTACGRASDVVRFAEVVIGKTPFPCGHCHTEGDTGRIP